MFVFRIFGAVPGGGILYFLQFFFGFSSFRGFWALYQAGGIASREFGKEEVVQTFWPHLGC